MSSYVGVDLSTHAVDLVKLDEESDRAEWVRVPLVGENAIDRARSYREQAAPLLVDKTEPRHDAQGAYHVIVKPHFWDDVILCALEDPAGRGDLRKIARVQGVVIATIPARVQVWTMSPAEWRKACGLPGNCGKEAVSLFFESKTFEADHDLYDRTINCQDARDAYAVAYAARSINQTQEETA